jgi:hypothetical protein
VADHRYFTGLLALGNEAYDPMLQRREHSAHVNNGNMNVALTVNCYVRRAHSVLCSGSELRACTADFGTLFSRTDDDDDDAPVKRHSDPAALTSPTPVGDLLPAKSTRQTPQGNESLMQLSSKSKRRYSHASLGPRG